MTDIPIVDALYNAHPDNVVVKSSDGTRILSKAERALQGERIHYGKGIVIGVVAGLMTSGASFDDCWRLCLKVAPNIHPDCIPAGWPSQADYDTFDSNQAKEQP